MPAAFARVAASAKFASGAHVWPARTGRLFSDFDGDFEGFSSRLGCPLPRHREAVDIDQYLSEHTKELVQEAAQTAVRFNRREVDTEHLLYAIAGSDVVKEIFKQYKIEAEEVRGYLEANAPKGEMEIPQGANVSLGVSPRVKNVFELAFQTAQDLGHGYIGPEHVLAALLAEQDGMAADLLRKYGLTPESLRQKINIARVTLAGLPSCMLCYKAWHKTAINVCGYPW